MAAALTCPTPGMVHRLHVPVQVDRRGSCALGRSDVGTWRPGAANRDFTEPGTHRLPRLAGVLWAGASPTTNLPSPSSPADPCLAADGCPRRRCCRRRLSASANSPAPGASVTRPGVCTGPHADHHRCWAELWPRARPRLPWPAMSTGGSLADLTGAGCSRISGETVDQTPRSAAIAAKASSCPAARVGTHPWPSQPLSCCVRPSGASVAKRVGVLSARCRPHHDPMAPPRLGEHHSPVQSFGGQFLFAWADGRASTVSREDAVATADRHCLWMDHRLCNKLPRTEPPDCWFGRRITCQRRTVRSSIETAMHLRSQRRAALPDELRTFYTTKIRPKSASSDQSGEGLDRGDIATTQDVLNEPGGCTQLAGRMVV